MSPNNANVTGNQDSQVGLNQANDAPDKSDTDIALKNDGAPVQMVDGPARYVSSTGDTKLEKLERNLRNYVDKPTKVGEMIDTWLEAMECARDEDYYEKKYWAFLHGYLNLKMTQLLEN